MKKILFTVAAALASFGASAAPAPAPSLPPDAPLYLQYMGQEQIGVGGAHTFDGTNEINWGVFVVNTLAVGKVSTPHASIDQDTTKTAFFSNAVSGQITGMFYGIEQGGYSDTNAFPATSGFLDLYWRDSSMAATAIDNTTSVNGLRCGYSCATGFTDGVLLAHFIFDTGMDDSNADNTVVGSVIPTAQKRFSGFANAYLSVDMSQKGVWSEQLDANWFNTEQGKRDLLIENVYKTNTNWDGAAGSGILGAQISSGAGQSFALPEPGALSLMGLALVGMGAALRRRSRK